VKCQERLVAGGNIGLVGWLRDGALAHPPDHGRLVEQDLGPAGRGRELWPARLAGLAWNMKTKPRVQLRGYPCA
jgi:hypothetical protein